MGIADVVWMASIAVGAGYLLYRSLWVKKGCCQGCSRAGCPRRTLAVTGALFGFMLMTPVPVPAAELVGAGEATAPPAAAGAEICHSPAEGLTAGPRGVITKHVAISGLLEVEASFADACGSVALATTQLGLGVNISKNFGGILVLLAEDGGDITVDEATIDFAAGLWFARAGRQLLPFGRFNSPFVTDPLVMELGETKETALLVGGESGWLALSAFAFDGDARESGDEERLLDWGVATTITPAEGVKIGAGYLSDLADSGAGLLADTGNIRRERVAGWSVFAVASRGPVELSAEALGALGSFSAADGGGSPAAWNIEVAFDPVPCVEFALRYEEGCDLPESVERRFGAAASWSPREHVSLTAEILHAVWEEQGIHVDIFSTRFSLEF